MMRWSGRDLALVGSIAANLLLAGFFVGVGARVFKQDAGPSPSAEVGGTVNPRALYESFDRDERNALRQRFREEGERAMASLREAGEAREDFYEAMAAEPFDADAALDALVRSRSAERELQDRGDALMVQAIAELPAAERAAFVSRLTEWRQRTRGGSFRPDWSDGRRTPGAPGSELLERRGPGFGDAPAFPKRPGQDGERR